MYAIPNEAVANQIEFGGVAMIGAADNGEQHAWRDDDVHWKGFKCFVIILHAKDLSKGPGEGRKTHIQMGGISSA